MFLITGAKGQLGLCFKDLLADKALYFDIDTLDITDREKVLSLASKHKFEAIINCAAYTAVEKAEEEQQKAFKVNVLGTQNLAELASESNIPLVYFSTDYIFDGKAKEPISENAEPAPLNYYGKTKLEGEKAVLKYTKTAIIIRTAWLYSAYGKNFLKTILNLAQKQEQIKVVKDQIGTPTYAPHLAKAVLDILPKIKKETKAIYNYTDSGFASWYDFAFDIIKEAGLKTQVLPIVTKDYPSKVKRPAYSVLSKEKIIKDFNLTLNTWQAGVKKCLKKLF